MLPKCGRKLTSCVLQVTGWSGHRQFVQAPAMVNTILKAVGAPTPALATASGPNPSRSAAVSRNSPMHRFGVRPCSRARACNVSYVLEPTSARNERLCGRSARCKPWSQRAK